MVATPNPGRAGLPGCGARARSPTISYRCCETPTSSGTRNVSSTGRSAIGSGRAPRICRSRADFAAFWRDFEWMGVQRQLKVLGIFARLAHRDGKTGYVDDMPRVMRYLRRACARYRELAQLAALLDTLAAPGASDRPDTKRPCLNRATCAMILAAGRGERMRPLSRYHAEAAAAGRRKAADRLADRGARARRISPTSSSTSPHFGDRSEECARRRPCLWRPHRLVAARPSRWRLRAASRRRRRCCRQGRR